ncbi:MAG: imidazole glycerol phosphate synthase subunit HisH [Betaproteobacteria bacterium]|nr:imidazole glycerol phosphate synthase subunit HisH [Betaproteobacteria bacterium]
MNIAIIDYGMGNLRSVSKALEHVAPQARVEITSDPDRVAAADKLVFPGQGAMPDCMKELDRRGLRAAVMEGARRRPFLGICIGLQMLFDRSEEGDVDGLEILPGNVRRFRMEDMGGGRYKIPHMGWNEVMQTIAHPMWRGISDGDRFYFVHSYYAVPGDRGLTSSKTRFGLSFSSAVARENIFAVQFHPEKSQSSGLKLLSNFIEWNP